MTTRVTLLDTSTSLPPWSTTVWVPVSSIDAAEEVASLDTAEEATEEAVLLEEEPQAGQNTGCTYSSHGSDKRTTRNFFKENSFDKSMVLWLWQLVAITNCREFYQIHFPLSVAMATAAQIYVMVKIATKIGCAPK